MIPYSKLNSHGNDFILVENDGTKPSLSVDQIKHYSKRDVIGCDQFFIINTSNLENIVCDVFNQDGTKACQCGNGLRATMLYLNKKYNLKRGDKVLVPAMTWVTNVAPVIQLGLEPIFCDVEPSTFSFDLEHLQKLSEEHNDIKVVLREHSL